MKKGKRDQRQYDLVQQHLPGLILSTILRIVEDLGDPYRAKPGLGGMTAYPPKAMAVVCILMEAEARTYRKMVGHLRMNRGLAMKIGLPKIPSKSTIWRAYGMIPEPYLREVHTRIIGDVMVTGSVAGDSTGYSSNRFVRWFSIRHDQRLDPLLFFKPAHPAFQARFRQTACSASHSNLWFTSPHTMSLMRSYVFSGFRYLSPMIRHILTLRIACST